MSVPGFGWMRGYMWCVDDAERVRLSVDRDHLHANRESETDVARYQRAMRAAVYL